MHFVSIPSLQRRQRADVLVFPFWQGKKGAEHAADFKKFSSQIASPIKFGDFSGKEGEVVLLYPEGGTEKRLALLGMGKKETISVEKLRRNYANLTRLCQKKQIKDVNLLSPHVPSLSEEEVVLGVVEGLLLPNYSFDKHKQAQKEKLSTTLIRKVSLIGISEKALKLTKKSQNIFEGVYLTRDLVNENADAVTPQYLSDLARALAKRFSKVKTTVFDKKRIEKEKMGLLLAVSRGSSRSPAFIIMEYRGNPQSRDYTVIVGKGITYDTGGLNLKPSGYMETMKCDMAGAATCFGTVLAAASMGLKANFTAVVPSCENSIDSNSYKPGDVYKSYLGKTVEIGNTDAEGRLILADALGYVQRQLKPKRVIDFATLTGAIGVALGEEATGLMANDDALADALIRAGSKTFERLWRLPLYEEYRERLKSDIADLNNCEKGRSAGAITAAAFLQEFVGDIPWAHCDIASTAYLEKSKQYHNKYATGVGVRLMIEFLETLQ